MQHPLPSAPDLKVYYDESYGEGLYKEFIDASDMKRDTARYRFKKIAKYVKKGKLLDVGCSDGLFVKEASQNGVEAEGIDISKVAIGRANKIGVKASCTDLKSFSPGYRFQTITGFDVLEHVLDPDVFIRAAKNLLEPGGQLILSTPNINSIQRSIMKKHWYFYIPEEHFFYFNPAITKRLLSKIDFEIVKCERLFKPLTLEYGLTQFAAYNPIIYKMLKFITAMLPDKINKHIFLFYIGEMMVIARNNNCYYA